MQSRPQAHLPSRGAERPACSRAEVTYQRLKHDIRHQFRIMLVPGRKDESRVEHREILASLEYHDAPRAEQAMRHHMAQLRRSLQQLSHLPVS